MKKKVLILYATAGIGHKKASMAVKATSIELLGYQAPEGYDKSVIRAR